MVFSGYMTSSGIAGSCAAAAAMSLQSCPTLCDPIDGSPPGSPVPGILQARTLEWVANSFSNAWKVKSEREVAQLCPTLHDPMDCSPPGSSVHSIFRQEYWSGVPSPSPRQPTVSVLVLQKFAYLRKVQLDIILPPECSLKSAEFRLQLNLWV